MLATKGIASMLVQLPASLGRTILLNWLHMESLGALDSAHCNKSDRATFLELLASIESCDGEFFGLCKLHRLRWMTLRSIKCSKFYCHGYIGVAERKTFNAYIPVTASSLKQVSLHSNYEMSNIVLNALAANHCALEVLVVMPTYQYRIDGPTEFAALRNVLSNSAATLIELKLHGSVDKYITGDLQLPALLEAHLCESSDEDLLNLSCAATNVAQINLDDPHCSSTGLAAVGSRCQELQFLSIWKTRYIVNIDEGIAAITSGCPKLLCLGLYECHNLTEIGLREVAVHCTQLHDLSVSHNALLTDASLISLSLSANARTLKSLSLRQCTGLSGTGIVAVAMNCTALESLKLPLTRSITVEHVKSAMQRLTRVSQLNLSHCNVDDEVLQLISEHIPHLKLLDITPPDGDAAYTSTGLMHIAMKCEKLQRLDMGREHRAMHDLAIALWKKLRPNLAFGLVQSL